MIMMHGPALERSCQDPAVLPSQLSHQPFDMERPAVGQKQNPEFPVGQIIFPKADSHTWQL